MPMSPEASSNAFRAKVIYGIHERITQEEIDKGIKSANEMGLQALLKEFPCVSSPIIWPRGCPTSGCPHYNNILDPPCSAITDKCANAMKAVAIRRLRERYAERESNAQHPHR